MDGLRAYGAGGVKINSEFSARDAGSVQTRSSGMMLPTSPAGVSNANDTSFVNTLKSAMDSVNRLEKEADISMQKVATGQSQNLHETMIAAEKADIALRLMVQVRNKLVDAYQEIMKMQV